MKSSPESVLKDLHNQQFEPVYFLQGQEPYYIDLISDHIEANVLEESQKGFNLIVLYGRDVRVNEILTNARRFPMMSERQVVIVKEAQEVVDLNKEDGRKLLSAYLETPAPSTILVFCHKHKKLDGRSNLTQLMTQKAVFVDSTKLYENQIPSWINSHLQQKGYTIENQATLLLTEYIGNNLERLSSEIEKMLINLKEKSEVTVDDIDTYVGISKEYNVFEFLKALSFRDSPKALQIINYFAANPKINPIQVILAVLYRYYSNLLRLHHGGLHNPGQIASKLRVPSGAANEYSQAMGHYPMEKVIHNIQHLRRADNLSKGIDGVNPGESQILKELLFRLLH